MFSSKFVAVLAAAALALGGVTACSDSSTPQAAPSSVAVSPSPSPKTPADEQGFALQPSRAWNFGDASFNELATDFPRETGGDGWGNNEVQYYTDGPNAFLQNGNLVIVAKKATNKEIKANLYGGRKYTSARLTTKGTFEFTYGKVIWKSVVLPKGDGTWSALWAWPAGKKYGESDITPDPTGDLGSLNGEIDVMENVGVEAAEINCSAHAYAHHPKNGERSGQVTLAKPAIYAPHTYRLDWTPDYLQFWVDGTMYKRIEKLDDPGVGGWPYDQPYFLIMNVAMGGDWGGMYRNKYGLDADGIDPDFEQAAMSIGAIEYYPYVGVN